MISTSPVTSRRLRCLLTTVVIAFLSASPSKSQEESPAGRSPSTPQDKTRRDFGGDCMSAGCHAQLNENVQVHGPVAVGACETCHLPDGAEKDHRFKATRPGEEVCRFCHSPPPKAGTSVHQVFSDGECLSCHDPHGGATRALLVATDEEVLCKKCHESKLTAAVPGTEISGTEISFKALHYEKADQGCLVCHRPHQSDFASLLRKKEVLACFACHGAEIRRPTGVIRNVQAELAAAKHVHKPIAEGLCADCHGPHSSESDHLLTGGYTSDFYNPFSESSYELCFSCHDRKLATDAETIVTAFRDGTRNLHYLHVNREKGRSCAACHDPHGSTLPGLLRESVPFGPSGWGLPIGFEKTADGGTCTSGCHKKLGYKNRL